MSSEGFISLRLRSRPERNSFYAMGRQERRPVSRHLLSSTLHMRLFVALDIEQQIRERIASFVSEMRGLAPAVRWVQPESLHITLKFIGERPDAEVKAIENVLRTISAGSLHVAFRGAGFF